jgi:excisionase family DNA binding protein
MDSRGTPAIARGLLDVSEAAAYLGISRSKLYQLLAPRGSISTLKIGKLTRVPVKALDAWIEQQTQAAAEDVG